MDSTVVRWSCLYWQKKRFLPDIYAKYSSDIKTFVHKVKEREKCYFFLFLHKSLAQKLWKIWLIIGLGRVSRDVMRLHWRHMTLFRLAFPKRYSYTAQQKCVNIFAFIDCNYRVGCSCNVSEMWAETVSCAFSEALWRHATPVRDLLHYATKNWSWFLPADFMIDSEYFFIAEP